MHITAHLDVDMVAVETEDDVSVLLEIVRRVPGWCFILGPLMAGIRARLRDPAGWRRTGPRRVVAWVWHA
jgi:hypothetical protein